VIDGMKTTQRLRTSSGNSLYSRNSSWSVSTAVGHGRVRRSSRLVELPCCRPRPPARQTRTPDGG
jgi:hypothetical protein